MAQVFSKVRPQAADNLVREQHIDEIGGLMGNTIDNGGTPSRQGPHPLRGVSPGAPIRPAITVPETGQPQPAQRAERSQVQFSDSVAVLQRLQQQIKDVPDQDTDRIEQARQAIADGSYRIDFEQVAAKMLALEAELP